MKDKNRQFDETGAFLDLMSKREKKRWEKEQKRIKEEEEQNLNNVQEKVENNFETETIVEVTNDEQKPEVYSNEENLNNNVSIEESKEEEKIDTKTDVNELEKTQKILEVTTEINTISANDDDENDLDEDDTTGGFNPVIPIGISLIFIYAFFIYIAIATDFVHEVFLTVNIAILSVLTLFFGLTTLSNKKHINVFAIFDLIIILSFILFNGISLISYDDMYKEKEEIEKKPTEEKTDKPVIEKEPETIEKHIYNCENESSSINIIYNTENNYITYIKRSEILSDEELVEEISEYYKDINGINVQTDVKEITIEFDFNKLDINQYKIAVTKHNDSYRLESDFSYIEDNKILADEYKNLELKNLTCTEIKS